MDKNTNVLTTTQERYLDVRVDDVDEESAAVITQTAFEAAGATLAQDIENEPGEDALALPQSPDTVRLSKEKLEAWAQEEF